MEVGLLGASLSNFGLFEEFTQPVFCCSSDLRETQSSPHSRGVVLISDIAICSFTPSHVVLSKALRAFKDQCSYFKKMLFINMDANFWGNPLYQATKCHLNNSSFYEDVLLVEFMYLVFTHMPGESYCRQLRSFLLYLCYAFCALINSLVC